MALFCLALFTLCVLLLVDFELVPGPPNKLLMGFVTDLDEPLSCMQGIFLLYAKGNLTQTQSGWSVWLL